jgi:DNA replication protein
MMAPPFAGFGVGTKALPVPAPVLSSLLEEIDDIAELKCTLRFLWYVAQEKGTPRRVAAATLDADSVLIAALGSQEEVSRGFGLAVSRGTIIEASGWRLLRTPENERALARLGEAPTQRSEAVRAERPNVYQLYEANIGMLTPMIADQLRSAEDEFPAEWIEAAIREAVTNNALSWRYAETVLERWKRNGKGAKPRGEPGRHPEKVTAAEYLKQRRS